METPHEAAQAFIDAVDAEEADAAWALLEPDYRATLAGRWYDKHGHRLTHGDRERDIAEIVAGDQPAWGDLYKIFLLDDFLPLWPREHDDWEWTGRRHTVSPDVERLYFADPEIVRLAAEATPPEVDFLLIPNVAFYMRRQPDGTWAIAGLNEEPT